VIEKHRKKQAAARAGKWGGFEQEEKWKLKFIHRNYFRGCWEKTAANQSSGIKKVRTTDTKSGEIFW
jgi:hypothetical protein